MFLVRYVTKHTQIFLPSYNKYIYFLWFQAPGYGDIRVTVEKVPDTVLLENTFEVVCRITNCW